MRLPRHRSISTQEEKLLALLTDGPHPLFYLSHHMQADAEKLGLSRLVREGILQRCGLTPTDLLHVRGDMTRWNVEAARHGAQVMAERHSLSLETFLQRAFAAVENRLMEACIQAAADFAHSAFSFEDEAACFFLHGDSSLIHTDIRLKRPVVALGAPVKAWLPDVCRGLHTQLIIPEHAEVANAVGTAVGQVMITAEALIRPDQYHKGYIAHTNWGNPWFEHLSDAEAWADRTAREYACNLAARAGGGQLVLDCRTVPTYTPSSATKDLLYSAATVGYKIGSGLTGFLYGFVLDAAGYNGLAATQTALAHTAISALFLLLPIVAWGVLAIVLWVYKLDREYADIMRDLQAGRYSPKTMLTNQNP